MVVAGCCPSNCNDLLATIMATKKNPVTRSFIKDPQTLYHECFLLMLGEVGYVATSIIGQWLIANMRGQILGLLPTWFRKCF